MYLSYFLTMNQIYNNLFNNSKDFDMTKHERYPHEKYMKSLTTPVESIILQIKPHTNKIKTQNKVNSRPLPNQLNKKY